LKQAIRQPNDVLRLRAFDAIENVHPSAYATLKPYRKQMAAPSADVSEKVEEAFADFAKAEAKGVEGLVAQLRNRGGWRARWDAAIELGKLGEAKKLTDAESPAVVAALRKSSEDGDYDVREKSVEALGLIGEPAAATADRVMELIGDPHRKVQVAAMVALGRIGGGTMKLDKVVKLLNPKKSGQEVIRAALAMVAGMGAKAAKAFDKVVPCLKSNDTGVKLWAMWAMVAIAPKKKETLAAVEKRLSEPHPRVQAWAAAAHAKLTGKGDKALPAARRVLVCREEDTRRGVVAAYAELGATAELLAAAAADASAVVRREAVAVLGDLRESAVE